MIRNAIILCAGLGSRLAPLTEITAKPLIKVNGRPIIETTIECLIRCGITRIILVLGYHKNQFYYLKNKYRVIKFVFNANYANHNNIASLFVVRRYLPSSLVIEGDILVRNGELFNFSHEYSSYNGFYVNSTSDWYFKVDDSLRITYFAKAGHKCYQMVGISYWTKSDGLKLAKDLKRVYLQDGKHDVFWDQVPLEFCKESYDVKVKICNPEDAFEIDTISDLISIDKSYL